MSLIKSNQGSSSKCFSRPPINVIVVPVYLLINNISEWIKNMASFLQTGLLRHKALLILLTFKLQSRTVSVFETDIWLDVFPRTLFIYCKCETPADDSSTDFLKTLTTGDCFFVVICCCFFVFFFTNVINDMPLILWKERFAPLSSSTCNSHRLAWCQQHCR